MANANLHAVVRIKTMARAAASAEVKRSETGGELAAAYGRLRGEARALNARAGWGDEAAFDQELPPLTPAYDPAANSLSSGRRALVLLGQLAAWAEGHQEAFEIEARLQANAEAKHQAQTKASQGIGFRAT